MLIFFLSEIFLFVFGGSGCWFFEFYLWLLEYWVYLVVGVYEGDDEVDVKLNVFVERMVFLVVYCGIFNFGSLWFYWRLVGGIVKWVKGDKIDELYVVCLFYEGFVLRIVKMRIGCLYWCYVYGEDVFVVKISWEFVMVMCWVLKGVKGIIVNFSYMFEMLKIDWGLLVVKVELLNFGVDVDYFVLGEDEWVIKLVFGWEGWMVLLMVGCF